MRETELRLAAIENLLLEWLALEPTPKLQALLAAVRAPNGVLDADEGIVREASAQLVEDAIRRFDEFNVGQVIREP